MSEPTHPDEIQPDLGDTQPVVPADVVADGDRAETAADTAADTEDWEPAAAELPTPTFADFDVHPDIVASLSEAGIVHPFPIQAMTLPVALGGHDIIGQAKTGTGKTLGFGVPMIQRSTSPADSDAFAALGKVAGKPQALAVAPTRELAVQVSGDLERAGKRRGVRVLTVYGGRAYEPQVEALRRGVEIVVGTPGRLLDLAQQGHLDLSHVRTVVLDEADEMLDLGFLPDVEKLLAQTPAGRQTMLFSATMPGAVVALARRYMTQPTHIRAMGEAEDGHTVKAIEQFVYRVHAMDKVEMLARMLQAKDRGLTLIFSRTKRTAAKVADELADRGFAAAAIHGDLGQGAREQALRAFRNGKIDVLVATDVAARGIDVANVTHVVNYQCPEDEKTYLHRTGRTGRAGNTGVAVTFVDWDDLPRWALINKGLDLGIPEPLETYSSSDNLFDDLEIPRAATGRLPRADQTRAGLDAEQVEDLGEVGRSARKGLSSGSPSGSPSGRQGGRSDSRGEKRGEKRGDSRGESRHESRGGAREESSGATSGRGRRSGNDERPVQPGRTAERSVDRTSDRPEAAPDHGAGDQPSRPARSRQRRRTRGGKPSSDAPA